MVPTLPIGSYSHHLAVLIPRRTLSLYSPMTQCIMRNEITPLHFVLLKITKSYAVEHLLH
jgi:hypothetical protein